MLFLFCLVGCGSVELGTSSDSAVALETDGQSTMDAHRPPLEDGYRDAGGVEVVDIPPEGCPSLTSACAACTQAGQTGPGYPTAATCVQVIGCVRSGDGGAYPWQSCHNLAGGGADWGGLACAQRVATSCP